MMHMGPDGLIARRLVAHPSGEAGPGREEREDGDGEV